MKEIDSMNRDSKKIVDSLYLKSVSQISSTYTDWRHSKPAGRSLWGTAELRDEELEWPRQNESYCQLSERPRKRLC